MCLRLIGHVTTPEGLVLMPEERSPQLHKTDQKAEMDTQRKKSKQGEKEGNTQQLKRFQGENGC